MRYLFGCLCVCALGATLQVGCDLDILEGLESRCEGVVCEDDGNPCTWDDCRWPPVRCEHGALPDATACTQDGVGGVCINGGCVEFDGTFPCTEQGIRLAIVLGGGPHTLDCDSPTSVVTQAEIEIDNDVILDGGGNLFVDAVNTHRVFSVLSGITAELRGVTVMRGAGLYYLGGGIFNEGDLTLTNSTVSGNVAEGDGGGIYTMATLTLTKSTVSDNVAEGDGGGIGGRGSLTLINSTVSGNSSEGLGGGIGGGINLMLINSTVSGNTANSNGGGIGSWGNLMLINSTVSGNTANSGGGIESGVNLTLANSTVSGNTARFGEGGGIGGAGNRTLTNSLIAGDCFNPTGYFFASNGYNIESPGNTCGFDRPTDQVSVSADDLKLGPLQDNGGPTKTHALLPGSIAIDWISVEDCVDADGEPLTTDQRGEPRPDWTFKPSPRCDVGSFEVQR